MDLNEYMDGIEKQNEELRRKLAASEAENWLLKRYSSATRIMVDTGESHDPPFYHINISPEKIRGRADLQESIRQEVESIQSWEHVELNFLRVEMVRYYSDYTQRIWCVVIERDRKDKLWKYTEHAVYNQHPNEEAWGTTVDWMNKPGTI